MSTATIEIRTEDARVGDVIEWCGTWRRVVAIVPHPGPLDHIFHSIAWFHALGCRAPLPGRSLERGARIQVIR